MPFLAFMFRPPRDVANALLRPVVATGLAATLGERLSAPGNLHQSASDRHPDTEDGLRRMRDVGDRLAAHAFDMVLDRITGPRGERIDLRFEPSGGRTPEFLAALAAVRAAFGSVDGISDPVLHAPHLTFCYGAPAPLKTLRFPAVSWHVDRIELVRRMHDPYRYDTVACWPLLPATRHAAHQRTLF